MMIKPVLAVLFLLSQIGVSAFAQDSSKYPTRPITLIATSAAGGTTDITARMLSQPLGTALGQTVIVDNKAGANGSIGAVAVAKSAPDGYTLMLQYSGYHIITPLVSKSIVPWSNKDFEPVANILSAPQLVVIRGDLPFKTLGELIVYAKANPGKLNYASAGNGSIQHVTGAMLEQQAGIKMTHIPYKGSGPVLQDLLGGQVDVTFGTPPPFIPHIQSGKLRALATTGKKRLVSLPDVPTAIEAGLPKFDAYSWFAVFAPRNTPASIINKLTNDISKIVATPEFKQKAIDLGAEVNYMNPKQLNEFVNGEYKRWDQVIKAAHIEAD
jgi:tripartite-type tricarboxylate transporter receptor subunit TctC